MLGSATAPSWFSYAVLGLVVVQRMGELAIANRNTRALMERGAVEFGKSHYPFIVALHAAWLAALVVWVAVYAPRANLNLLVIFAVLQVARLWILWTLGPLWTTRIISLPGVPLVRRGPYKFMSHPNYFVVVLEIAVLPLALGALMIAAVFSALNAAVLFVRIRTEETVLAPRR